MKTVSARYPKGGEPPRRLADDLRLIGYIIRSVLHYFVTGRRIRRIWFGRQRAGEKFFLDEA